MQLFGDVSAALSPIVAGAVTVRNVTNRAQILGDTVGGGILGMSNTTGDVNITIEDSVNSAYVSGSLASGFIGNIQDSSNANVFIRNCSNSNEIKIATNLYPEVAGGAFVGQAMNNQQLGIHITGCTNTALVTMSCSSRTVAGGLVGFVYQNQNNATIVIEESTNNDDITVSSQGRSYAGGLVGCANANFNINVTIVQSTNNGNISATTGPGSSALGGGLVGEISSNTGTTTVSVNSCSNTGSIMVNFDNDAFAGGLLGRLGSGTVSAVLRNCANKGNVTGANNDKSYSSGLIGGVQGGSVIIENSVNKGHIKDNHANGISSLFFFIEQCCEHGLIDWGEHLLFWYKHFIIIVICLFL